MHNIYDNHDFFNRYKEIRLNPTSYNEMIEVPRIKELLPNLYNKTILDIGCGMGQLVQYMLEQSPIQITGIDISSNMIQEAKENIQNQHVTFLNTDFMEFDSVADYDVIVSSLAFHYIEDYKGAVQKVYNHLKNTGVFIFSIEHPVTTATRSDDLWSHVPDMYDHYKLDHYFESGMRSTRWLQQDVIKYHRTMEELLNTLLEAGFKLERIIETGNTELSNEYMSHVDIEKINHRPSFVIFKAVKE